MTQLKYIQINMEEFKRYYKIIPLIVLLIIFIYGFLCRILNLYFFWESKNILIFTLLTFVIALAIKELYYKRTLVRLLTVILFLFFLFLTIKDYYIDERIVTTVKYYVLNNKEIQDEVGNIKEITMIQQVRPRDGDFQIEMIVKGNKKYKDITTILYYKDGAEKKNENLIVWRHQ